MDSICPKILWDHGPDNKAVLVHVLGKWRQHPWWTIQIQYKIYSQLEEKTSRADLGGDIAMHWCPFTYFMFSSRLYYYFFHHKLTFTRENSSKQVFDTMVAKLFYTMIYQAINFGSWLWSKYIAFFLSGRSKFGKLVFSPKYLKIEHLISFSCVGRCWEHKNLFWHRARPLASDIKVLHLASINICRLSGILRNVPFAICINHYRTASTHKDEPNKMPQKIWD